MLIPMEMCQGLVFVNKLLKPFTVGFYSYNGGAVLWTTPAAGCRQDNWTSSGGNCWNTSPLQINDHLFASFSS